MWIDATTTKKTHTWTWCADKASSRGFRVSVMTRCAKHPCSASALLLAPAELTWWGDNLSPGRVWTMSRRDSLARPLLPWYTSHHGRARFVPGCGHGRPLPQGGGGGELRRAAGLMDNLLKSLLTLPRKDD